MTPLQNLWTPSDEQLVDVAGRIREIMRHNGLARTLAIGHLMLERFYGGDEKLWRCRRAKKSNSIRRLAARPDCPVGKSTLNEAVGVYVAARQLPFVACAQHIGAGHVAAVLRLDHAGREYWLQRAEREKLSVRELRALLVDDRRANGERRGRPALKQLERLSTRVRGAMRLVQVEIATALLHHRDSGDDCDRLGMDLLCAQLTELQIACEQVLSRQRSSLLVAHHQVSRPDHARA